MSVMVNPVPAKRIETASILGCISLETAQNEMHGGQAIPAFDFYLAPYVRNSFIEEVKVLEEITGEDYKHLYHFPIKDYVRIELDGLSGDERVLQHAINRTVSRVHQSMEAFIHNMNTIHSREAIRLFSVLSITVRILLRRPLYYSGNADLYLSGSGKRRYGYLSDSDLEKETGRELFTSGSQLRLICFCL